MKKLYFDTSVISHLKAPDTPERMRDTLKLWNMLINNSEYYIIISPLTIGEMSKCEEPKKSYIFKMLQKLNYKKVKYSKEILRLRKIYLEHNILSEKDKNDLLHIAVVNNSDCVVSWNFKHMVKEKTIRLVNSINASLEYKQIKIVSPSEIIGGVEDGKREHERVA